MKVTSAPALASLTLLAACGGGSSPSSPSGPGTTPQPGHPVSGFVFYDENANGALDAGEAVRLPGATVSVGGRTGQATAGGQFTVSGVPSGSQSATAGAGLPAYFVAGPPVTVDVPQTTGSEVAVPAVLEIGDRNRPNHFLAIGDSITRGVGGGPGVDYPGFLAADLTAYWGEAMVINAGDPGTRSRQGESTAGPLVARHRPAYTLILYGTNDWNDSACRGGGFPCYTMDALRSMILQARDGGSNPILGTIPPANPAFEDKNAAARNVWVNDMNALVRTMAQQEGVPIAEIHRDFMAQPSLEALFADHVHPNEEGYLVMTRSWFEAITNTGTASAARGSFGFWPYGS